MARAKNQPRPSAIKILDQPHVLEWIKGDLSFVKRSDDCFKNKTEEKDTLKARENAWAWELYNKAVPWNKAKRDGKWSGDFAERIFREIAPGWKPMKVKDNQLDWEDENFVYEVKTQFHLGGGTAQDKILGTPVIYRDVPEMIRKPLRVVCFAAAATLTREVLDPDCPKIRDQLALWKSWGVEYVWGSDLIKGQEST